MAVHPSAIIHPGLNLPDTVSVGPFSIIEEDVTIAPHVSIGANCHIYGGSQIGSHSQIFDGAIVGSPPQDLKYTGEKTQTIIGSHCVLREYVTVNRGTSYSFKTLIEDNCYIMTYCHVAHDCVLEKGVMLANGVQMGGHVRIGEHTVVLGMTGIHQFSKIGKGCYVGGGLRVAKDIPPFSKALGEPLKMAGPNSLALKKFPEWDNPGSLLKTIHNHYRKWPQKEFLAWLENTEQEPLQKEWLKFFAEKERAALSY